MLNRTINLDALACTLRRLKNVYDLTICHNGNAADMPVNDCIERIDALCEDHELAELGMLADRGDVPKLLEALSYGILDFQFNR